MINYIPVVGNRIGIIANFAFGNYFIPLLVLDCPTEDSSTVANPAAVSLVFTSSCVNFPERCSELLILCLCVVF